MNTIIPRKLHTRKPWNNIYGCGGGDLVQFQEKEEITAETTAVFIIFLKTV